MRRVIFDTETTGLNFNGPDRVIEIACVELDSTKMTGIEYQVYVNPRVTVHPDALKIHGITDAFLSDKPEFEDIADEFLSFIGGAELIAHNAPFDVAFINKELRAIGHDLLTNPIVDTLAMARRARPGKRNSLDALATAYKLTTTRVDGVHGAIEDCRLLAKVYCHLMQTAGAQSLSLEVDSDMDNPLNLSGIRTRIGEPSAEELAAHRAMCAQLGIKPF